MSTPTSSLNAGLEPLKVDPISRGTLALFAGASGDHHPMHIDSDYARDAGMSDVFAHGMLSMAYLGRLLTDWIPQERLRSFRVRFSAITPLHAQPICSGRVVSVQDGEATVELTVRLEDGTTTLTGEAIVRVE